MPVWIPGQDGHDCGMNPLPVDKDAIPPPNAGLQTADLCARNSTACLHSNPRGVTVKDRITDRTPLQNPVCGENLMKAGELIRSFLFGSRSWEQFSTAVPRLSP